MEDRKGNTVQFDLAYVEVDEQKVLTVFDNASTTTLLLRDLRVSSAGRPLRSSPQCLLLPTSSSISVGVSGALFL